VITNALRSLWGEPRGARNGVEIAMWAYDTGRVGD
jgi:hypothetical protein